MRKLMEITVFLLLATIAHGNQSKPLDTTILCGLRLQDPFTKVIEKYGQDFRQTTAPEYENITVLIYNDPKQAVHLTIGCNTYPFPGIKKAKIGMIVTQKGLYQGKKYFAKKSFAHLGTLEKVTLGASKETLKTKYPKINFWKEGNLEFGDVDRGSNADSSYSYLFTLKSGKVISISSSFHQ